MKEHHIRYNGDPMLGNTLTAVNLTKADLPRIEELWDSDARKRNICFSYLLGRCPRGRRCYQAKKGGHIEANALPPNFIGTFCQLLGPGVTWMVKNGEALSVIRDNKRKHK